MAINFYKIGTVFYSFFIKPNELRFTRTHCYILSTIINKDCWTLNVKFYSNIMIFFVNKLKKTSSAVTDRRAKEAIPCPPGL